MKGKLTTSKKVYRLEAKPPTDAKAQKIDRKKFFWVYDAKETVDSGVVLDVAETNGYMLLPVKEFDGSYETYLPAWVVLKDGGGLRKGDFLRKAGGDFDWIAEEQPKPEQVGVKVSAKKAPKVAPGALGSPMTLYALPMATVRKTKSDSAKVVKQLKGGDKVADAQIVGYLEEDGIEWYYSKNLKGFIRAAALSASPPSGSAEFVGPPAPGSKPKPTSTPSFGLAQSQPTPVVEVAPAPSGLSTPTIIAIGLAAVAGLLFLMPKGKG